VRTEPAGARVSVDGLPRGTSPVTVADLTPGEHAVLLESDFGAVKQVVTIEPGQTASLMVPLSTADAPVSGWIAITAPADVQIFEKNRLIGTSQTDRLMVSAGRHDIDIVNDTVGYRTTRTVQVGAGKVTPIKIEFPKGTIALNAVPWAEVWIDGQKVVFNARYGNYLAEIGAIGNASARLGQDLNTLLTTPGLNQEDLDAKLGGFVQTAETQEQNAEALDPPGPMVGPNDGAVEALQFRVNGLKGLQSTFKQTTAETDASVAGVKLAAQTRKLLASDVVWADAFQAPAEAVLQDEGIEGLDVPSSVFVTDDDLNAYADGQVTPELRCGGLVLDPRAAKVMVDGTPVKLTSHEFRVLSYLMHQRGRVVSQGELTEHIYAHSADRDSNTVEVFIARLRRKLGGAYIETVRGLGYRIEAAP
jgi:hypothetical protein